jgi:predicted HicB family RNase H-like nuclease
MRNRDIDFRVVTFRIDADLHQRLTDAAKDQERSLAREMTFRLKKSFAATSDAEPVAAN